MLVNNHGISSMDATDQFSSGQSCISGALVEMPTSDVITVVAYGHRFVTLPSTNSKKRVAFLPILMQNHSGVDCCVIYYIQVLPFSIRLTLQAVDGVMSFLGLFSCRHPCQEAGGF